jgi:hypothetical protein
MTLVWVLTALFVWYSSSTVWQADIRLGYFTSQAECEAVGMQLDPRQRYRWEGMEAGPAWLRGWRCEREAAAGDSRGTPPAPAADEPPPLPD